MKPLYVHGMGLWTHEYADVASYCRQRPDAEVTRPIASLLTGPAKRRASLLTRMAVEVFGQAAAQAGADVSNSSAVWASAHGEIHTAVELMAMMHIGEGKLSPTKFHNSVYNTPSGYASIACGNRAPCTTLTGGPEIVGSALVEAAGLLQEGAREVLVVWADEPHPHPFESKRRRQALALALCLSLESEGALGRLSGLRREPVCAEVLPEVFDQIYPGAVLPLLERIAGRRPGRVALEMGAAASRWTAELAFS